MKYMRPAEEMLNNFLSEIADKKTEIAFDMGLYDPDDGFKDEWEKTRQFEILNDVEHEILNAIRRIYNATV